MNKNLPESEKQLSLPELRERLNEEMRKPENERDGILLAELKREIHEMQKNLIEESKKRSLENVMKMLDEYEKPRCTKLYKTTAVLTACLLVFIGINTASLKVFGQNIFSASYQFSNGGIHIILDNPDNDKPDISESDPYGMKAKCAEYGFFPDTPAYIPDGFTLKNIKEEKNEYNTMIIFLYTKGDAQLNFFLQTMGRTLTSRT